MPMNERKTWFCWARARRSASASVSRARRVQLQRLRQADVGRHGLRDERVQRGRPQYFQHALQVQPLGSQVAPGECVQRLEQFSRVVHACLSFESS